MRNLFVVFAACVALGGCGGGGGRYGDYAADADATAEAAEESMEEARQVVYEEHRGDSDGTVADPSNVDAYDVEDSGNYVCARDCTGHGAGFEWAQENDITDASGCGGNSQSFIEGCEAFVQERQDQADREAQDAADQAAEDAGYQANEEAEYEDDRGRLINGGY